jgi:hypothetical protein
MLRTPARLVTASLLLASAAAFAIGVAAEHAAEHATASSEGRPAGQHADVGAHTTPRVSPAITATSSAHARPVPATTANAAAPAPRPSRGGDGDNGEAGTASPAGATPGSDEQSAPGPARSPATASPATTSGARSAAGDRDNGEPAATGEPAARGETGAAHAAESQSEKLFGINPEATGLVVIAVTVSLLLAALILTVGSPLVPAGLAVAMLAFTALDVREVTHQLTESRSGLAALAATVALLHLLTAVSAMLTARAGGGRADSAAGRLAA